MLTNSRRCLAVMNQKGGVLKTSIAASIAGTAAMSGWRTLLVDFDPQGDLDLDLGYAADSDGGEGLAAALRNPSLPVPVRTDVRPQLDVITGGPAMADWIDDLNNQLFDGYTGPTVTVAADALSRILEPVAADYSLIVIDTAPGERLLRQLVISASGFVLLPSKSDPASQRGLNALYGDIHKWGSPELEILGVVLGPVGASATALRREARSQIDALTHGTVHIFDTVIRHAERAAVDGRARGQLPIEYGQEATEELDRRREDIERLGWVGWLKSKRSYSGAAGDLAADYQDLAAEVLTRFNSKLSEATVEVTA